MCRALVLKRRNRKEKLSSSAQKFLRETKEQKKKITKKNFHIKCYKNIYRRYGKIKKIVIKLLHNLL